MKNEKRFKEFITLIGEKYQVEVSKLMARMVWEAVRSFDDEACVEAFTTVIQKGRFYKDLLPDLMEAMEGSLEDKALRALMEVEKAVRQHGPWPSVKFVNEPVSHSVIDSFGGWPEFQNCSEAEWVWRGKDFVSRYKRMVHEKNHPPYLPGQAEIENSASGFVSHIPKPVLIGRPPRQMIGGESGRPKLKSVSK
ncbi:MAG: hypothetical protein JW902_17675 [Syntrophaceae bacterium]|nr:hypothetical protein [Syntrophaceae bacterium]